MKRLFRLLPLTAISFALASCGGDSKPAAITSENPSIQTVNYPLAYFAERIAGEHAEVVFAAPADGDPAFWKPSDAELSAFQKADLTLLNGATYAKWTKTASLPGSRTVDTSEAFADKFITVLEATTHTHGDGEAHAHAGTAFTTWLDFSQARQQARAITDALSERLPAKTEAFQNNFAALAADLDKLHADMQAIAKKIGDQPLFASHPVYQYWSRAYGLNVVAVHWEPEVVPDAKALEELIKKSEGHAGLWMIWEGIPAAQSVAELQHLKIRSVVFDPCGNRPDGDADWLSVMRQNLENLEALFPAQ
jgi:zinc transport system substrate-binding protein